MTTIAIMLINDNILKKDPILKTLMKGKDIDTQTEAKIKSKQLFIADTIAEFCCSLMVEYE